MFDVGEKVVYPHHGAGTVVKKGASSAIWVRYSARWAGEMSVGRSARVFGLAATAALPRTGPLPPLEKRNATDYS